MWQYINNGKKPVCLINFTCILLENHGHSALCVLVSSKNTFLRAIFAESLVVSGHFGSIEGLMTSIQKSPCQSLKRTPLVLFIRASLSAFDSTAQNLAANFHQNGHF